LSAAPPPWLPSSISFVGGTISAIGLVGINLDGDATIDLTLPVPVTGSIPGPSTLSLNDIGDDRYYNTGSLDCDIFGTIATSGFGFGIISCTGTLDFYINIYNDAIVEVSLDDLGLTGSGFLSTFHDGSGDVTISGSLLVSAAPVVDDFDNDGDTDDTLFISKTVDLDISGTIDFSNNEIDISSGGYTVTGFDVIDISSAFDPPMDIMVPESGSLDLAGQTLSISLLSAPDPVFFFIEFEHWRSLARILPTTCG